MNAKMRLKELAARSEGLREFTSYWNPKNGFPREADTPEKKKALLASHIRHIQKVKAQNHRTYQGIAMNPNALKEIQPYLHNSGYALVKKQMAAKLRELREFARGDYLNNGANLSSCLS